MDDQITAGAPGDLHSIGAEPEFGGDAHDLAVAIHEHPTGENVHNKPGVYASVHTCSWGLWFGQPSGRPPHALWAPAAQAVGPRTLTRRVALIDDPLSAWRINGWVR